MTPVTHLYPDAPPPDGLPSVTVADRAGISYRMLDHWLRCGYVTCAHNALPGSGHQRIWTPLEAAHVYRMAELVRARFWPDRAAELAREIAEQGSARVAHGYTLHEAAP